MLFLRRSQFGWLFLFGVTFQLGQCLLLSLFVGHTYIFLYCGVFLNFKISLTLVGNYSINSSCCVTELN